MSGKAEHIRCLMDIAPREREILEMLARGWNTKTIAAELNVSEKTVEYHRLHLMNRSNFHSFAELTRLAVRLGVADINP